jgi:hypothetical protein
MGADLGAVAGTIGAVPVLGLVMNISKVVGYSLSIWHNVKVIKKANKDHQEASEQLKDWETVTNIIKSPTVEVNGQAVQGTILDRICHVMATNLPDQIKLSTMEAINSEPQAASEYTKPASEEQTKSIYEKLAGRVTILKAQQEKAIIDKKKSRASIINAVNNIALAIIILVGMIVAPVVTMSVLAAYGLYMSLYGLGMYLYNRHLEKSAAAHSTQQVAHQNIEVAIGDFDDAVAA